LEIGNPVERLLELADKLNPQLVVLGIPKHSSSESLIGTVSSQFLRSRRYPILLVP
jgi:nucleotide-binding universal stress UspA family protein